MKKKQNNIFSGVFSTKTISLAVIGVGSLAGVYVVAPYANPVEYQANVDSVATSTEDLPKDITPIARHIKTPEPLKAIYMSQCVVGTPSFRNDLVELIDQTELNDVIIDIKDYTGKIAFPSNNPLLKDSVSDACGARDMRSFIEKLHEKNIYVIGRITVFQDPYYTSLHPELAVKKLSASTTPWKDRKGLNFIDVGARPFWEYIATLAEESYKIGFDEINFDYVRFPSDGDMKDIYYTWSKGKSKPVALEEFFSFLSDRFMKTDIVISADLFGMTTTNTDDLNIGQVLERALPHFDYVAPMVYPSHYPSGFNGWSNPNDHVYDVIHYSMSAAVLRVKNATTTMNKRTGKQIETKQLRPWLQDFDYGGNYGPVEVRAQIQATYDSGLTSWMLWAPSNRYTKEGLKEE